MCCIIEPVMTQVRKVFSPTTTAREKGYGRVGREWGNVKQSVKETCIASSFLTDSLQYGSACACHRPRIIEKVINHDKYWIETFSISHKIFWEWSRKTIESKNVLRINYGSDMEGCFLLSLYSGFLRCKKWKIWKYL